MNMNMNLLNYYCVSHILFEAKRRHKSAFQVVDIVYLATIDALLERDPDIPLDIFPLDISPSDSSPGQFPSLFT